MTTGDDLLRAILSDPADDTVRLAYADWLEENCHPERAEFIRVQCRIARLRCECRCGSCVTRGRQHHNGPCAVSKERDELPDGSSKPAMLIVRERQLWAAQSQPFVNSLRPISAVHLGDVSERISMSGLVYRGFISEVTCTAEDWLRHADAIYWHPDQQRPFLGGHVQPVERVRLTTEPSRWPPLKITPGRDGFTCDSWPGIVFRVPSMFDQMTLQPHVIRTGLRIPEELLGMQ